MRCGSPTAQTTSPAWSRSPAEGFVTGPSGRSMPSTSAEAWRRTSASPSRRTVERRPGRQGVGTYPQSRGGLLFAAAFAFRPLFVQYAVEDAELFVGAYDRQTIVGKKHRMAVGELQPAFAAADGHDRDAVAATEVDLAERPSCDDRFGRDAEFGHVELFERQLPFIQRPFCIGRVVAAEVLAQTLLHFERTAAEPFREDDAGEQRQRHGEAHARSGVEQRRHDGHQNPDAEQAFDENERDERPAVEFAVVPQLPEFGRAVALPEHDEQDRRQHGEDRRQTHCGAVRPGIRASIHGAA